MTTDELREKAEERKIEIQKELVETQEKYEAAEDRVNGAAKKVEQQTGISHKTVISVAIVIVLVVLVKLFG